MLHGRNLERLGCTDVEAKEALEVIEILFGADYLETKNDIKPLSVLWNRTDRLATSELFVFGKCLQKINAKNQTWLKQTVREIKNCPGKAKGLFTEIFFLGTFDMHVSEMLPAQKFNPGYDFSVNLINGQKIFISVKNIDISDEHKKFQASCRRLRAKWREKLRLCKLNLGLTVFSELLLSESDFALITESIQQCKSFVPRKTWYPKPGIGISTTEIQNTESPLSSEYISDQLQVFAPGANSEKKRYSNTLRQAAKNLCKHTKNDAMALRILFLRMHVNADYEYIRSEARILVDDPESKIDCIMFYQPSYVRDASNSSAINHCLKVEVNSRFAETFGSDEKLIADLKLGTVSSEQAPVLIRDLVAGKSIEFAPSDYFFQQGDIYKHGELGDKGISMNSPAPGVKEHSVWNIDGNVVVISSKIIPDTEDLVLL